MDNNNNIKKYMFKRLRVRNNTQAKLIPAALLNRMYLTYGSAL